MARRPAQYGTAQVKKREPIRPLLVLLLIFAGGILLFLWLEEDSVDPLVTVAEDTAAEEPDAGATPKAADSATGAPEDDLTDWWYSVESLLYDAFRSMEYARSGDCADLEYAVSELGAVQPRHEQQIRAPFAAVVGALDSAVAACRNGNAAAVTGAESSAKAQVKSLQRNLEGFGVPPSDLLSNV